MVGGFEEAWENGPVSKFEWLESELRMLEAAGLVRDPEEAFLRERVAEVARGCRVPFVDACSNDYLGYAGRCGWVGGVDRVGEVEASEASHIVSRETLEPLRTRSEPPAHIQMSSTEGVRSPRHPQNGAGASRLLGGTRAEHSQLESALAAWVHQSSALLFTSGYAANLGLISALAMQGDVIFSDALNHASIVDGCRLSKAQVFRYPHRDLAELQRLLHSNPCDGRRIVVTESYFSMDGDSPNLQHLRDLSDDANAVLIVDEAHALGIFGPHGCGLAGESRVVPDITVGTLGKSVGLQGAFVAAPEPVRSWLWNRARSFVYSTGTPPLLARQTLLHVKQVQRDEPARMLLHARASKLRAHATSLGLTLTKDSFGPIVPIVLGDNREAFRAANELRSLGILAYPVRPPTVPEGTARLRLTVSSGTTDEGFSHLLESLTRVFAK